MHRSEILLNDKPQQRDAVGDHEALERFLTAQQMRISWLFIDHFPLDFSRASVRQLFHTIVEAETGDLQDRMRRGMWHAMLGYYFGEALRRHSPHLNWSLGEAGTAFEGHPVITGFSDGVDAAVVDISRNIITCVVEGGGLMERIDSTIDRWFHEAEM